MTDFERFVQSSEEMKKTEVCNRPSDSAMSGGPVWMSSILSQKVYDFPSYLSTPQLSLRCSRISFGTSVPTPSPLRLMKSLFSGTFNIITLEKALKSGRSRKGMPYR